MATTKISVLPELTSPSSNGSNTIFVVVDKSSGTFTTKQLSLTNLNLFVDDIAPLSFNQANLAFSKANSANVIAQAGWDKGNSANTLAQTGYDKANSANVLAQVAYDKANLDTTSIATSPGFYGDSISVATFNLAANGRVISASNVAITANANTLTFNTLASGVTNSSLTSVGTLTTLTVFGNTTVGNLTISTGGTITGQAAAGNVSANAVGYMGEPQNNLTSDYVITLADQGKHLYYNVSTSSVLYIPTSANVAFPIGATIDIISMTSSSANVTITPNTGVSLYLTGNTTPAGRNVTTYGTATLFCVDANTWFVRGSGISAL